MLIARTPLVDFLLTYSSVSYAGPKCALQLGLQPKSDPLALQNQWRAFGSPFMPGHLFVESDAFQIRGAIENGNE